MNKSSEMDEMETKIELFSISRAYIVGVAGLGIIQLATIFYDINIEYLPVLLLAAMMITRTVNRLIIKRKMM
ncbi:hypothetical protein EJF36_17405 [Bacillus sp. HMF5848]|uniref:hypothetical protein n=1 Tax=Bacillus sp. HMF5848 TaxID=2495421 RepID=UPI000F7AA626|nr:hypothetical protein [Bacillus sp. HMF5848]RSK28501.1 hypothetical protein EJF36_17405 [Bacillus sp. HMF5848]